MPVLVEDILQEAGIEHDVAMVADEKVFLVRVKLLHAAVGEFGDGTADDLFVDAAHDFKLEVADGAEGEHHFFHLLWVASWIDVSAE